MRFEWTRSSPIDPTTRKGMKSTSPVDHFANGVKENKRRPACFCQAHLPSYLNKHPDLSACLHSSPHLHSSPRHLSSSSGSAVQSQAGDPCRTETHGLFLQGTSASCSCSCPPSRLCEEERRELRLKLGSERVERRGTGCARGLGRGGVTVGIRN